MLHRSTAFRHTPDKLTRAELKSIGLGDAAAKALPVIEATAESAGIAIETDIPEDLPEIHGDVRALKKIRVSLTTSAIKHSRPNGKVRLSAAMTTGGALALRVEDDGVGMDVRLIDALMREETESGIAATTEGIQGIGLFVVRKLADMHEARWPSRTGCGTAHAPP